MSSSIVGRNPTSVFKGDDGKWYTRVSGNNDFPFSWDAFTIDRTGATQDVYNYTLNAVPSGTVTITYTDTSKCEISGGSIVAL
jgi:hypothetical protein